MNKAELLDDREGFRKIDRCDMLSFVDQLPEMLVQARRFSTGVSLPNLAQVNQVLVLGMGGSAIAGDLAADLFLKSGKAPILGNRSYALPEFAGPATLVFAISYSGDTEETIAAVKEAEKKNAQIICITAGGRLREIAENKKHPLFLIPSGFQPRAALAYLFLPLAITLGKLRLAAFSDEDIGETIALLRKLREEYGFAKAARINPAKQLAKKWLDKIPLIFGSAGTTGAAALRFKTQLNENSKAAALMNLFPELNHNELVSLAAVKRDEHNFVLTILRDEEDSERTKKRIEITKSLLCRQLGGITEVYSQGKSRLARIFSLVMFGDYTSVYLAALKGIDPTPVEIISRLKKEMQR